MDDKEFNDHIDKLLEAIDKLEATTEKMSNTVSKMIDYCSIITLVMFITIVIAFIF